MTKLCNFNFVVLMRCVYVVYLSIFSKADKQYLYSGILVPCKNDLTVSEDVGKFPKTFQKCSEDF